MTNSHTKCLPDFALCSNVCSHVISFIVFHLSFCALITMFHCLIVFHLWSCPLVWLKISSCISCILATFHTKSQPSVLIHCCYQVKSSQRCLVKGVNLERRISICSSHKNRHVQMTPPVSIYGPLAAALSETSNGGWPPVEANKEHVQALELAQKDVCCVILGINVSEFDIHLIIWNETHDLTRNQQIPHGNKRSWDCGQTETKEPKRNPNECFAGSTMATGAFLVLQ
jgi:hypothetical protein